MEAARSLQFLIHCTGCYTTELSVISILIALKRAVVQTRERM